MKKRLLTILIAVTMVINMIPFALMTASAATAKGTTGECTWSLDTSTSTLTISGNGKMPDYTASDSPWYAYREMIKAISIGQGVTCIGNYAFVFCSNLKSVSIPSSVTAIGNNAFYRCSALTTVEYWGTTAPSGNSNSFSGATSLFAVKVPTAYSENTFCGVSVVKSLAAAPANPKISVTAPTNGNVAAPASATAGATVAFTVTPHTNYEIDTVTVSDGTNNIQHSPGQVVGAYTFTMPEKDVTITATFKATVGAPTVTDVSFDESSAAYNSVTNTFNVSDATPFILTITGEHLSELTSNSFYSLFYGDAEGSGGVIISITVESDTKAYVRVDPARLTYILSNAIGTGSVRSTKATSVEIKNGNNTVGNINVNLVHAPATPALSVSVAAVDVADGSEIEGATIQLLDEAGYVEDEWVSTISEHEISGLVAGKIYTVHTTIAPDGYTIATDTRFTLDEQGKISSTGSVTADGAILVEFEQTEVSIAAVDIADSAKLEGATIQLLDDKGDVVEEWTSATEAKKIRGLVTNEVYTVHTAVAPNGYGIPTDFMFVLDENGNITCTGSVSGDGTILIEFAAVSDYTIKIDSTVTNGTVTADKTEALEGETVTLTVTPDEGYELESLTATDANGKPVTVENNSFTMPASNVTVSATFKEVLVNIKDLNQAVKDLEDKIADQIDPDELAAEIKRVTDLIAALDDTYVTHDELAEALVTVNAAIKKLNDEIIPELQGGVSKNAGDIAALNKTIDDLTATVDNIKTTLSALSQEDGRLADLISTLDASLSALSDSLDSLEGRVDTAEKDIDTLEAELAAKYAELKALIDTDSGNIAAINETLKEIKDMLATLATKTEVQAELDVLNGLIEDLTDRIEENESNISANINAISSLQSTLSALQSTVMSHNAELEQSISSLSSALSILETRVEQNEQDISALNTNLQKAIEDLNKAITEGDKELSDEIDALTKALNDANAALEKADTDNKAELEKKIEEADTALDVAIKTVQKNLDDAKAELEKAMSALDTAMMMGNATLYIEIESLNTALTKAKEALEKADIDNKAELVKKIEDADAALDSAIKAVQKNLDDAKSALEKALADGDKANSDALAQAVSNLNAAIDVAKAAAKAADGSLKSELTAKIDSADAAFEKAIKVLADELESVKNALEAKDNELQTFIIIVCVISVVAFCGCAALAVVYFIDRKKRSDK